MESNNKKKTLNYYGGDKLDENDEESLKLYLSDCRKRQAALYSTFQNKYSPIGIWMQPLTRGELLSISGQSRFHLLLGKLKTHDFKQNNKAENFDFLLFKQQLDRPISIPKSLDEEADMFRTHGLPLVFWPESKDKSFVIEYLKKHYSDCGFYFEELDKVNKWLTAKWKPLADGLGITSTKLQNEQSNKIAMDCSDKPKVWLTQFPQECIAAGMIRQRLQWYENYAARLKSYLLHRVQSTPAFNFNPIHKQLQQMSQERVKQLDNDSGFLRLCGEALLTVIRMVTQKGRPSQFQPNQVANKVNKDSTNTEHQQCLFLLLPPDKLKSALANKNAQRDGYKFAGKKLKSISSEGKSKAKKNNEHDKESSDDDDDDDGDEDSASDINEELNKMDEETEDGDEMDLDFLSDDDDLDLSKNNKGTDASEASKPCILNPQSRPMTKAMMENRGLMKYRHKRERNPRVHMRYKFKKACTRYKSRMPTSRREDKPYAGELTGIRANLVRAHKFKGI